MKFASGGTTCSGCERVGKRIDLSNLDDVLPEPSTLQMIDHRNVVPVVAAAYVDGFPAAFRVVELITPYFPRGSVTDALLRGEKFLPSQAVAIVQAALRGQSELHEVYGIAHRDIKSGNILLADDDSVANVADLGLAGQFDEHGMVPALNNPTLYSPPGADLAWTAYTRQRLVSNWLRTPRVALRAIPLCLV